MAGSYSATAGDKQYEAEIFIGRIKILRLLYRAELIGDLIAIIFPVLITIANTKADFSNLIFSSAGGAITFLLLWFGYRLVEQGNYKPSAYLFLIFNTSFFLSWSFTAGRIGQEFIILPVMIAGILFERRVVVLVTTLVVGVGAINLLALQNGWYVPPISGLDSFPQIITFAIATGLVAFGLLLISTNLKRALLHNGRRTVELEEAYLELDKSRRKQEALAEQLRQVIEQLGQSAQQQAGGASLQAYSAAVVLNSVEELGQTARQIAVAAQEVSANTLEASYTAAELEAITAQATSSIYQGNQTVSAMVEGIKELDQGISALSRLMADFAQQSSELGSIATLIDSIAGETHLLALNAAIESAGAGVYGERFAVIAQEVKSLADRCRSATDNASRVIFQSQERIASAVAELDTNRVQAGQLAGQAQVAAEEIDKLSGLVKAVELRFRAVKQTLGEISGMVQEVALSTNQQQNASQQVLEAFKEVENITRDFSDSSQHLAQTANQLEQLAQMQVVAA